MFKYAFLYISHRKLIFKKHINFFGTLNPVSWYKIMFQEIIPKGNIFKIFTNSFNSHKGIFVSGSSTIKFTISWFKLFGSFLVLGRAISGQHYQPRCIHLPYKIKINTRVRAAAGSRSLGHLLLSHGQNGDSAVSYKQQIRNIGIAIPEWFPFRGIPQCQL